MKLTRDHLYIAIQEYIFLFQTLRDPHLMKQRAFGLRDQAEGTFDKHEYLGNESCVDKRLLLDKISLMSNPQLYLSINIFFLSEYLQTNSISCFFKSHVLHCHMANCSKLSVGHK